MPSTSWIADTSDFDRLCRFHETGSFFVIRAKTNLKAERRYSHAVDRSTGLVCDQTVTLAGFYSHKDFPAPLRRIRFKDPETGKRLVFLSNNFALPALTITKLYRLRWQIGVSSEGHAVMSVKVRPEPKDSGFEAREAPWRESKTAEPSDNMLERSMREASGCNVQ